MFLAILIYTTFLNCQTFGLTTNGTDRASKGKFRFLILLIDKYFNILIFEVLNLFTVVRFANAPCQGITLNGTCFTRDECQSKG